MLQVPASGDKAIAAQTVYTVRMCTGSARGSGMTEQRAGVWLGLVGQDGSSYLHRAVPLSDPDVIEQELLEASVLPGARELTDLSTADCKQGDRC
jgi:hypothetical protein